MSVDLTLRRAVTPRSLSSSVRAAIARTMRRSEDQPVWYRPSLTALLVATGVLYIWGLGASGWANGFYSAAVQAGSSSWKAWFFGSFDASNAITVDKPPAALWVMGLSARLFGVNAWSILVPQALMGVGTVAAVVATVKRWFRPGFALLAGAIVATTPVAALMFRFNNPDALLVLLLTVGAYAMTRAVEDGRTRWLVLAGALVGFGFLTKMLQAFVVLPAFGLMYLVAGPGTVWRRMRQGVVMAVATFVAAGWWVAIVELWPKSSRPYIGGSTDNSVLELVFGYNGFGRLTGNETGSVGGGANGGNWGPTGWLRMFNDSFGGQISWLLPAALVLLVAGLAITIRRARTDRGRAALIMWGGWLLITGIVFSLSKGIIHEYYTVALAPAIGATIAIGAALLWEQRRHWWGRMLLAVPIVLTAWWTLELLDRSPGWNTWLQPTVVVLAAVAVAALAVWQLPHRAVRPLRVAGVAAAVGAALLVPTAASVATAAAPHEGSIPLASPATTGGRFGGVRGVPFGNGQGPGAGQQRGAPTAPAPTGTTDTRPAGQLPTGRVGGIGGLLTTSSVPEEVKAALTENADQYRWVLATVGANQAAGYQLATGEPVMAIGGFNGTDPSPTLEQFQQYVADGAIHYFTTGGTGGRSESSSEITTWVEQNFTPVTIGGLTLYDLTEGVA